MLKLNQILNYTHLKDLGDKLYDIYWDNIGWRIRSLKTSVKNVIRWFPIIWKDKDWDDHFIWEILKTKLKHQADYISKQDGHTQAQYDAQKMRLCVSLIEKIQDEFYGMEYMDYHVCTFDFNPCEDREGYSQLEINQLSENFDDYFNKYKASVRKVLADKSLQVFKLDGEKDKQYLAMNVARYNEKKAQNLLFKILNRDIRGWWD